MRRPSLAGFQAPRDTKLEEAKAKENDPPKKGDQTKDGEVLDVKQGEEELTICGKKLKADWVETQVKGKIYIVTTKTWSCNEVPGREVKKTMNCAEGTAPPSSVGEVVNFKADEAEQQKADTKK